MNKFTLIILSILGGVEVVFYVSIPMVLGIVWISIIGQDWTSQLFFVLGILATIFRGLKVGWINK